MEKRTLELLARSIVQVLDSASDVRMQGADLMRDISREVDDSGWLAMCLALGFSLDLHAVDDSTSKVISALAELSYRCDLPSTVRDTLVNVDQLEVSKSTHARIAVALGPLN